MVLLSRWWEVDSRLAKWLMGLKARRGEPRLSRFRVPKFTHGRCNKALCAPFYRIPCPGFRISSDAMPAGYVALNRCQPPFLRFFERAKVRPRRGGTFLGYLRRATFLSSRNSCLPAIKFFAFLLLSVFSFFFFFCCVVQQIEYKVGGYAITVEPPWSRIQHFDICSVI